jgi:hypothetical protein
VPSAVSQTACVFARGLLLANRPPTRASIVVSTMPTLCVPYSAT